MKITLPFAFLPFLCTLFFGLTLSLPWSGGHPSVKSASNGKQIYQYFVEIDAIISRLATWTPRDSSSDFPGAEKDLFRLGKTVDQATQALKTFQGTIDTQSVIKIDRSLKSSAKKIVSITTNVKAAQAVFVKYHYTTLIVQVLQASANQFSVLFPLLENHSPPTSFASLGYSISVIICSIGDAIETLQPESCTPQGLEFCKSLKGSKPGSIDTKPACQVVKTSDSFSQCSGSSTVMFKYGYDNSCIGKPQTQPWCGEDQGSGGNDIDKQNLRWGWSNKSGSGSGSGSGQGYGQDYGQDYGNGKGPQYDNGSGSNDDQGSSKGSGQTTGSGQDDGHGSGSDSGSGWGTGNGQGSSKESGQGSGTDTGLDKHPKVGNGGDSSDDSSISPGGWSQGQGYGNGNGNGQIDGSSYGKGGSISGSAFFEVYIKIIFGYTPNANQWYTVCNPPH